MDRMSFRADPCQLVRQVNQILKQGISETGAIHGVSCGRQNLIHLPHKVAGVELPDHATLS
jgi:hypothetical protein